MPVARAFFHTVYPVTALRPVILQPPTEAAFVTVLVEAKTEAEVRDFVRASHPDVTEVVVKWAPEETLPFGNLLPTDGVCPACGSAYMGLGLSKLPSGGFRWDDGWWESYACVCEGPPPRVHGVRVRVSLPGWWVRLRHGTYTELAEVVKRNTHRVIARTRDGSEYVFRADGSSRGKYRVPNLVKADLGRVPLTVPVR